MVCEGRRAYKRQTILYYRRFTRRIVTSLRFYCAGYSADGYAAGLARADARAFGGSCPAPPFQQREPQHVGAPPSDWRTSFVGRQGADGIPHRHYGNPQNGRALFSPLPDLDIACECTVVVLPAHRHNKRCGPAGAPLAKRTTGVWGEHRSGRDSRVTPPYPSQPRLAALSRSCSCSRDTPRGVTSRLSAKRLTGSSISK